ncbi:hypothetical protein KJ836_02705 [Patescibacteria group bacterium]|nr:hypothetical protein [Patescibacteria group bacterium]
MKIALHCKTCGCFISKDKQHVCSVPWLKGKTVNRSKYPNMGHLTKQSQQVKDKCALTWFGKKRPEFSGENHPQWKGDDAGYAAIHNWVRRNFDGEDLCEFCGSEKSKVYDWANISGKYKRNKSDWLRLCRSCHIKFDKGRYLYE